MLLFAVGEDFLGGGDSLAELDLKLEGVAGDQFERAEQGDGVHVVEEAEVGDAEDLALHFALAVGDDCAEAGFQLLDDGAGVEAFWDGYGGGCGGGGGRCEKGEAERDQASAGHGGATLRVFDQCDAAFGEVSVGLAGDVVEGCAEASDEGYRWGIRAFAELGGFALLAEIEVVARVFAGFHGGPGAVADGEIGEAGWDHDGFLRTADEDVNTPGVYVEVGGAEAGDAVDDQQGFGIGGFERRGDGLDVVAGGGGGFGGLDVDGFGVGLQCCLNLFQIKGFAVGRGDEVDLAAEGFGEGDPAFTEFTGAEDEDAVAGRGEVADRGFHGSGAGAGQEQDIVFGADELFELGEDFGVEGAEFGGAVVDVRGGHGELGGWEQWGRSGGVEAGFAEHELISLGKPGLVCLLAAITEYTLL